jgi:predicted RND superfamily exporter protein
MCFACILFFYLSLFAIFKKKKKRKLALTSKKKKKKKKKIQILNFKIQNSKKKKMWDILFDSILMS